MAVSTDEILAPVKGAFLSVPADGRRGGRAERLVPVTTASVSSAPEKVRVPSSGAGASDGSGELSAAPDGASGAAVGNRLPMGRMTYVDMFERMSPYRPPTPEELEKERKKQKREAVFAAIGDGISALSNLFFTTQYAPNAYDPSRGMAATTKARFDRLKKEREENQREYMDRFMQAMRWDAEDGRQERNWQHTIEREKVTDHYREAADARAQAKADRDAAMAELRMELMEGRIDQQEAAARAKKIEADYADAYWQSRIGKNNYRRPIGSGSRGGGSGKPGEYPWYDSEGNLNYAHSYEAMRQNALNHGTWSEGTQQSSTQREQKDRLGKTKGTTESTTVKPAKGHSTKPEGKQPNPMGNVNSGGGNKQKKKNPMG